MAESWSEIQAKLQAPFDEKDGYTLDDGKLRFRDAVYEKRLDEVFGPNWQSEIAGTKNSYTITVEVLGDVITRTGKSFQDACRKFGIGRYLQLGDD